MNFSKKVILCVFFLHGEISLYGMFSGTSSWFGGSSSRTSAQPEPITSTSMPKQPSPYSAERYSKGFEQKTYSPDFQVKRAALENLLQPTKTSPHLLDPKIRSAIAETYGSQKNVVEVKNLDRSRMAPDTTLHHYVSAIEKNYPTVSRDIVMTEAGKAINTWKYADSNSNILTQVALPQGPWTPQRVAESSYLSNSSSSSNLSKFSNDNSTTPVYRPNYQNEFMTAPTIEYVQALQKQFPNVSAGRLANYVTEYFNDPKNRNYNRKPTWAGVVGLDPDSSNPIKIGVKEIIKDQGYPTADEIKKGEKPTSLQSWYRQLQDIEAYDRKSLLYEKARVEKSIDLGKKVDLNQLIPADKRSPKQATITSENLAAAKNRSQSLKEQMTIDKLQNFGGVSNVAAISNTPGQQSSGSLQLIPVTNTSGSGLTTNLSLDMPLLKVPDQTGNAQNLLDIVQTPSKTWSSWWSGNGLDARQIKERIVKKYNGVGGDVQAGFLELSRDIAALQADTTSNPQKKLLLQVAENISEAMQKQVVELRKEQLVKKLQQGVKNGMSLEVLQQQLIDKKMQEIQAQRSNHQLLQDSLDYKIADLDHTVFSEVGKELNKARQLTTAKDIQKNKNYASGTQRSMYDLVLLEHHKKDIQQKQQYLIENTKKYGKEGNFIDAIDKKLNSLNDNGPVTAQDVDILAQRLGSAEKLGYKARQEQIAQLQAKFKTKGELKNFYEQLRTELQRDGAVKSKTYQLQLAAQGEGHNIVTALMNNKSLIPGAMHESGLRTLQDAKYVYATLKENKIISDVSDQAKKLIITLIVTSLVPSLIAIITDGKMSFDEKKERQTQVMQAAGQDIGNVLIADQTGADLDVVASGDIEAIAISAGTNKLTGALSGNENSSGKNLKSKGAATTNLDRVKKEQKEDKKSEQAKESGSSTYEEYVPTYEELMASL